MKNSKFFIALFYVMLFILCIYHVLLSHLREIIPLVLFLMLYHSAVFAQSFTNSSSAFTNNLYPVCVYVLNEHLMYGSNSCKTEGTPTVLSQVKRITSDVITYLVNTDKVLYVLMLNHYQCSECNLDISKLCRYDYNGNLIPTFSDDQKKVLLDLQANYSFTICPFAKQSSIPAQLGAASYNIPDPLKQFRSGVPAKNIKCQSSLELVINAEDGTPACVTPDGAITLAQRGWIPHQDAMKEKMTHEQSTHTIATIDLKDQASCQETPLSGMWYVTNSTCVITNLTLAGDSLIVNGSVFPSIVLTITGTINNIQGSITNNGTINTNGGTINNNGIFTNNKGHIINANQEGSVNTNDQGSINNNGIFNNNGTINTMVSGTINANDGGLFTNYGIINNIGSINNYGIFNTKGIITNLGAGTIINYGKGAITNYAKSMIANNNTIINYGTVTNYGTANNIGTLTNIVGGTIINKYLFNNNGTIANNGVVINNGTINNRGVMTEFCGSTITGNPVVGLAQINSSC
jgi:hypothetical protein